MILVIFALAGGPFLYKYGNIFLEETILENENIATTTQNEIKEPKEDAPDIEIVGENLDVPWDIAFLPEGDLLVPERSGTIIRLGKDKSKVKVSVPDVKEKGEGGLLGLTLHPKFSENNLLYIYITHTGSDGTINSVKRYHFLENKLTEEKTIISNIPGAPYHDGGRIEFGPDGFLYITTGDATKEDLAQDRNSLAGKILRVSENGEIPKDNPFGTAVYSYGHRNPQGIAWDDKGNLWSTEHGRSGVLSGLDELNVIVKGGNYGWPTIQGSETREGMASPVLHSGADVTWAPASAEFINGSIFFGGLRGETLYEAKIVNEKKVTLVSHFYKEYGRIRAVRVGTDGFLYFTTSNQDGRGNVKTGDDKIVRVGLLFLQRKSNP